MNSTAIPPLNLWSQENYLMIYSVNPQQNDGQDFVESTPLRWLLGILEKIIFVETLSDADDAETISDPESFCPVCLETYRKPHEVGALPETGPVSRLLRNERPLKLDCGHIIGKNCLRRIIDMSHGGEPKCPLCRRWINTTTSVIPLIRSRDRQPDIVGLLCCVIRLYILSNRDSPETHEGLYEWVHGPTFLGRIKEEHDLFIEMRNAVDIWEEFGEPRMWRWILARKRGELPNEELGTVYGRSEDSRSATYTALLDSNTPVLQRDTMSDV